MHCVLDDTAFKLYNDKRMRVSDISMNIYRSILTRATRWQIVSYLLYGDESVRKETRSIDQRIQASEAAVLAFASREFSANSTRRDKLADELMEAMSVNGEAYFEMGLLAGAQLYMSLTEPRRKRRKARLKRL